MLLWSYPYLLPLGAQMAKDPDHFWKLIVISTSLLWQSPLAALTAGCGRSQKQVGAASQRPNPADQGLHWAFKHLSFTLPCIPSY